MHNQRSANSSALGKRDRSKLKNTSHAEPIKSDFKSVSEVTKLNYEPGRILRLTAISGAVPKDQIRVSNASV